jgi:hypothetical protein
MLESVDGFFFIRLLFQDSLSEALNIPGGHVKQLRRRQRSLVETGIKAAEV